MKKIYIIVLILIISLSSFNYKVIAIKNNVDNIYSNDYDYSNNYELIGSDLSNSKELKTANVKFEDVLYYHSGNRFESHYLIMEKANRVTIDYTNNIFDELNTYDEKDDKFYKSYIDESKTVINRESGTPILEFYGYYFNSKKEKKVNKSPLIQIEILTKSIDKNRILYIDNDDTEYKQDIELENQSIRFDTGMTVAKAKEHLKDLPIEYNAKFAYLNDNGELKENVGKIKYYNIVFSKETKNNDSVELEDSERLTTGIDATLHEYLELPDNLLSEDDSIDGKRVSLMDGHGIVLKVACVGDITGTGIIEMDDLVKVQEEITEKEKLENEKLEAADINNDNVIDVIDLSRIQELTYKD